MGDSAEPEEEVEVVGGLFPYGFWRETKALFKLAWPLTLSILFHYLIQPISLMFCGHLGSHQLAAVGMAISVIYITTVSLGRGLAFGGDTYFSQTYGSRNKLKMGIYLQRGLIFGLMTSFLIWAVLLNTESILLLIGQDPIVSALAQEYVLMFSPGVLAYCWLFLLMRYLLCQNRVIPNMIICVVSCGVNALLHYGLLFQADMGIKGSAIALMSTYYLVFFLFASYIWCSGIYKETWAGWSWEALEDWGPFGHTATASMVMTFMFWLCTEVGTFLAGILGEKEISAFQILFQVEGFAWMIPLGLGGACTARVGQFLGSNKPLGAITSTRVAISLTIFISVTLAVGSYGLKHYIPMAFTDSKEVIDYTEHLVPILSIFLLLEGFGGTIVGIVRGSGNQTLGAVIIFVAYYLIGLPVGVPLMFMTFLGQAGLWWGYVLGMAVQDVSLGYYVIRTDWYAEAEKAQIRAGVEGSPSVGSVNADQAPDEHTSLLGNEGNGTTRNTNTSSQINSDSYEEIGVVRTTQYRVRLVFKRLGILLIFVAILVGGLLCRIYIHVTPHVKWTTLCIPDSDIVLTTTPAENWKEDNFVTMGPLIENTTLPFCSNLTLGYSQAYPPTLWSRVGQDMRAN